MSQQTTLYWHKYAHVERCQLRFKRPPPADGEVVEHAAPPAARKPKIKLKIFDRKPRPRVVFDAFRDLATDSDDDDEPEVKQETHSIRGPPSAIIGRLKGHTRAQDEARHRLMSTQRRVIEAAAGYHYVLRYIALFFDITNAEECHRARLRACKTRLAHEARKREAGYKRWAQARYDRINADSAAERARRLALAPPLAKIRLIPSQGKRDPREQPLTKDALYQTAVRPEFIQHPRIEHTCHLCLNAKSHPVLMPCGHSACYVCLRLSLEMEWACPQCKLNITRRPVTHDAEAAEILAEHGDWDRSSVGYGWDGLVFPRKHTALYVHWAGVLAQT
ncbi:hypothetical protein K438DRAFT_1999297 [Mycena galopus ATCC 62051]|nr:hypothetical protein K438DRAFT_1999297 [Mycena galopus ATCC 62051]